PRRARADQSGRCKGGRDGDAHRRRGRAGTEGARVTRLYVVRHARTAWTGRRYCGRTDVPLTSAGRRDATALGSRLASIAGGALVRTSPLGRAVEPAALIPRARPFRADGRLPEFRF